MRDPKCEPAVGDILIRKKGKTQWARRVVYHVGLNMLGVQEEDHTNFKRYIFPYLDQYKKWASHAEVEHAA